MTNEMTAFVATMVSMFVPGIVSYLKRCEWPDYAKFGLAVAVSLVAATAMEWAAGRLDFHSTRLPTLALAILTVSTGFYHTWFKALGLEKWLNPEAAEEPAAPPSARSAGAMLIGSEPLDVSTWPGKDKPAEEPEAPDIQTPRGA